MKNLVYVLAFLMLTGSAFAQDSQSQDDGEVVYVQPLVKKKKVVRYDEATNQVVETPVQAVAQEEPKQAPIYILNNQKSVQGAAQTQTAVQEQPTTTIEASALKESRAEQMRRQRQGLESATEMKIVEKLEEARMEDERARSDRLFNNGFGSGRTDNVAIQQPAMAPAPAPVPAYQPAPQTMQPVQVITPVQVAAPVAVPATAETVEKADKADKVDVREEIHAAFAEMNEKKEDPQQYYIGAGVGTSHYPDVVNVKENVSSGLSVGVITPEHVVVEGSFIYSSYQIALMQPGYTSYALPPFKDMQQYNFDAAIKYQLLSGRIRPSVGALASYAYRKYADPQQYYQTSSTTVNTNAFDVGAVAGLDIQLTKNFILGADFRYYTNVAFHQNNDYKSSYGYQQAGNPVEKLDYYTATLCGKFSF